MLKHTPHIKPSGLIAEVFDKWGVKLNIFQAYKAIKKWYHRFKGLQVSSICTLWVILKSLGDQIQIVHSFCSMAEVWFCAWKDLCLCLDACIFAFAYTCKPITGIDAHFLNRESDG